CSTLAPTCAPSRRCWATPGSPPPSATPTPASTRSWRCTIGRIRGHGWRHRGPLSNTTTTRTAASDPHRRGTCVRRMRLLVASALLGLSWLTDAAAAEAEGVGLRMLLHPLEKELAGPHPLSTMGVGVVVDEQARVFGQRSEEHTS